MFKSVVFDIGQTLIEYNKPLNWSALYRPALKHIADMYGYTFEENDYQYAVSVLTKYNTRMNPREYEVSSAQIFTEILSGMPIPMHHLDQVKDCFYSFFRRETLIFPEVEDTLKQLYDKGVFVGTLSDVAYGMDNIYALDDIATIKQYINYPFTSNDVGYRKPNTQGIKFLAEKMNVYVSEIVFCGDEEKDMICAKNAGAYAVLINREGIEKNYAQDMEIHSLDELLNLF